MTAYVRLHFVQKPLWLLVYEPFEVKLGVLILVKGNLIAEFSMN